LMTAVICFTGTPLANGIVKNYSLNFDVIG